MENGSLQYLALAIQCAPELAPALPGDGSGILPSLRFMVSFQLLVLGSVAAAHLSGLQVGADLSHGLKAEGVLTQKVN